MCRKVVHRYTCAVTEGCPDHEDVFCSNEVWELSRPRVQSGTSQLSLPPEHTFYKCPDAVAIRRHCTGNSLRLEQAYKVDPLNRKCEEHDPRYAAFVSEQQQIQRQLEQRQRFEQAAQLGQLQQSPRRARSQRQQQQRNSQDFGLMTLAEAAEKMDEDPPTPDTPETQTEQR